MTMDEFLDSHPLPINVYEIECQTIGGDFRFLRALNPMTVKAEALPLTRYQVLIVSRNFQTSAINSRDFWITRSMTENSTIDIRWALWIVYWS